MKSVLMTGASGGIGSAIKKLLLENGYKVSTIGRRDAQIVCDLKDSKLLAKEVEKWLKANDVDVLINAAGFGLFDPLESTRPEKIDELISVNLTAPITLSHLCLKKFKKQHSGHIVNIASIEATRHAKFSSIYTATKSGLRDFSLSLFEELRGSGVAVSCINPDMTKTPFFNELRFAPGEEDGSFIEPETIAKTLLFILENPSTVCDITLRAPKFGIVKK